MKVTFTYLYYTAWIDSKMITVKPLDAMLLLSKSKHYSATREINLFLSFGHFNGLGEVKWPFGGFTNLLRYQWANHLSRKYNTDQWRVVRSYNLDAGVDFLTWIMYTLKNEEFQPHISAI